jgi:tetratricopeptide (TPR) repeat protein
VPTGVLAAPHEDLTQILLQANQAYERGDYPKAIEQYTQVVNQGVKSGEIHFNLGNAYFRVNQLGQAIFHFRKARLWEPRDPDINYNLSFAREKVSDKIENSPSLLIQALSFADFFTQKERYLFALFSCLFAFSLGLLHLYVKKEATRWAKNTGFAILILSLLFIFTRERTLREFGVVLAPEISVYSGFERDSVVLFKLHEGAEFDRTDSAGEKWIQITLADGKKGWVLTEGVISRDTFQIAL